jgi:hypothetical protein
MLKDEILKIVSNIEADPDVLRVLTCQYEDGRWVPMILIFKKDGKCNILKRRYLGAEEDREVTEAMEKVISEMGLDMKSVEFQKTH